MSDRNVEEAESPAESTEDGGESRILLSGHDSCDVLFRPGNVTNHEAWRGNQIESRIRSSPVSVHVAYPVGRPFRGRSV